ncbi:MAG: alpha/beta hydrolase fold domain-containing protein [Hyphomonadaceae bacterium]
MTIQSTIARLLLKLPPNWLVKASGGAPEEIGGRTLDPHFQFITYGARKQPSFSSMTAVQGQAASKAGLALFAAEPEPGVQFEDMSIPSAGHEIPARLYRPPSQDPDAPLMVYLHQGGGVIGDLEICHAFCSIIAMSVGCPVVSVDYRLAPEHPFPAGLEDAICAYEWALKNAESFGAPAGRAAVGGDSMGGNFSAILAQEMQRDHKPLPCLQLLIYPATDMVTETPSTTLYADTYPLSSDTMDWFMGHYLPEGQDLADVRISPGQEMDLTGLPPAILVTAGFDPLVDQGAAYAKRLEEAGVPVTFKSYDSLAHGFTAFTDVVPAADAACREIATMVSAAYARLKQAKP